MNKLAKYVNALFLVAAAVAWLISSHYLTSAIGYFQLARKVGVASEVAQHLVPLLVGLLVFVLLRRNNASYTFTSEAVGELTKVSWPNQKEVRLGTIVVIVTVLIAGLILGLLDIFFTAVVKTLIGL